MDSDSVNSFLKLGKWGGVMALSRNNVTAKCEPIVAWDTAGLLRASEILYFKCSVVPFKSDVCPLK